MSSNNQNLIIAVFIIAVTGATGRLGHLVIAALIKKVPASGIVAAHPLRDQLCYNRLPFHSGSRVSSPQRLQTTTRNIIKQVDLTPLNKSSF